MAVIIAAEEYIPIRDFFNTHAWFRQSTAYLQFWGLSSSTLCARTPSAPHDARL